MTVPERITIRRLETGDTRLMRSMLDTFGEVFGEAETYCGAQPGGAYLERLLANECFIAIVALHAGEVIGALAGYELTKFERERSEVYIYDLAVSSGWRRKGIATAMIEALEGIAADRGAYVIFVQADRGDDPAIALYTKLGVREDVHHFDIAVTRGRKSS